MIVEEPPYELVAVFADADAKLLFDALIERAQRGGGLQPFRWRSLRDPRRDAFRADPVSVIDPLRTAGAKHFLFVWDHVGSGREADSPTTVEGELILKLARIGIPDRMVFALAIQPELEAVFQPVWNRVKEIMSQLRRAASPSDDFVLEQAQRRARRRRTRLSDDFSHALERNPKEVFDGLLGALGLRRSSSHFQTLGECLSVPGIRRHAAVERLFTALEAWFPPHAQGFG